MSKPVTRFAVWDVERACAVARDLPYGMALREADALELAGDTMYLVIDDTVSHGSIAAD